MPGRGAAIRCQYLFLGFERIGGEAVFKLTDPRAPELVTYVNPRDSPATSLEQTADLGTDGLYFILAVGGA